MVVTTVESAAPMQWMFSYCCLLFGLLVSPSDCFFHTRLLQPHRTVRVLDLVESRIPVLTNRIGDNTWSHSTAATQLSSSRESLEYISRRDKSRPGGWGRGATCRATTRAIPLFAAPFASVTEIGPCIGSGSYGTVHYITALVVGKTSDGTVRRDKVTVVGKRAWTVDEIKARSVLLTTQQIHDKSARCHYYWTVEKHCLTKMEYFPGLPEFLGTVTDEQQREWMLFDMLEAPPTVTSKPSTQKLSLQAGNEIWHYSKISPSLQGLMDQDRLDTRQTATIQNRNKHHHLYSTSQALLLGKDNGDDSLAATLDVVLEQVLEILTHVHKHAIVHRDIKPSNILVAYQDGVSRLVLIDFGSAGDLSTAGMLKKNIGLSSRVAISPIYAAPEVFIDDTDSKHAVNFDCFSAALLYLQLLFQYLDERTESGFHQQLASVHWNLDAWLHTALQSKVRPAGLESALQVLEERPGLWKLLQDMLRVQPAERLSSAAALTRCRKILSYALKPGTRLVDDPASPLHDTDLQDGPYLRDVLATLKVCEIPHTVCPLHFVATFDRMSPMGLYLAEMDADVSELDGETLVKWQQAIVDARQGDVFVQSVVPNSQADLMGIFSVGDRLQGIGELPLGDGGFDRAVEMIKDQPQSVDYVTLHFDRKSAFESSQNYAIDSASSLNETKVQFTDQGAWSFKGLREAQEDTYILHDVRNTKDRSVLLAGVFDGHCGNAASSFVQTELPTMFSSLLNLGDGVPVQSLLDEAWNKCCEAYRDSCSSADECTAEYDAKEGVIKAYTGGEGIVGGTTATVFALDKQTGLLSALNCGDSRGLVVSSNGQMIFQTVDHTPRNELERFATGAKQGLDYSIPECRVGQWVVPVLMFEYGVGRSLEGPFVTSKGITSLADISILPAEPGMIALAATDGLWEVMSSAEVCNLVSRMRSDGVSAGDAAKALCSRAYKKSSSDNISAVVVYL